MSIESHIDAVIEWSTKAESAQLIRTHCIKVFSIAIILMISIKVIKVLMNPEEEIDKNSLFKIILLAIMLSLYAPLMSITNTIMRYTTFKDIAKERIIASSQVQQQIDNTPTVIQSQTQYTHQQTYRASQQNDEETIRRAIEEQQQSSIANKIISDIVIWIGNKIMIIMRLLQASILSILYIGGPIAIILEAIPLFEGTLAKWFSIYVTTHMMTPMFFIIDAVSIRFSNISNTTSIFMTLLMQIMLIAMYILAGKIATSFIKAPKAGIGGLFNGSRGIIGSMMRGFGASKLISKLKK